MYYIYITTWYFRKVNNGTRLYFVSEPYFKRDTSLLYVDLPSPHPAPTWNPLLEAGFQSLPSSIRLIKGKSITKFIFKWSVR